MGDLRLYNQWYIACQSKELRQKPLARTILGIPLVLFRGSNHQPTALLDRCPHRNIPLSKGWVRKSYLICKYHGWKFDEQGICQEVPGLCSQTAAKNRNAVVYPVIEQDNFVWVYCKADEQPQNHPYQFLDMQEDGFSTFCWQMDCEASLENVAENFLDATHTHFIHSGLVRTDGQRQAMTVKITRQADRVEAVYLDEREISGLIYRLLAPGCRKVVSVGRFIVPAIAQIEYYTDKGYKIVISLFITPMQENWVRAYSVVTFRWGLPNWLGRVIAYPLFWKAAQQDKQILQLQSSNIKRFQGESFVSTEIDVLRPHISYLLKKAESNQVDELAFEKTIQMKI